MAERGLVKILIVVIVIAIEIEVTKASIGKAIRATDIRHENTITLHIVTEKETIMTIT